MSRPAIDRRSSPALALLLAVAVVASVAWPLATYVATLALFGVAHVLSELRFVDLRYSRRLGATVRRGLLGGLAAIAGLRLSSLAGLLDTSTAVAAELGCGLALVALVLPTIARRTRSMAALAAIIAAGLAVAIVVSPAMALLTLAVVHNFTPLGFLVEATEGEHRRWVLRASAVVFAGVPVLIASGWIWAGLHPMGFTAPEASPLGYGPLAEAMRAYLPADLLAHSAALHLFSTCVYLQCVHYICVLLVMPRLVGDRGGTAPWPGRRTWGAVLLASCCVVVLFAFDFTAARGGYGVLAAVHAWVELPLLLLAFGGLSKVPR